MEPKRLCRASIDKKICGVCGGIAHYFDVDSNLIRLITAALMLAGGLSIWLYIIAAIIMVLAIGVNYSGAVTFSRWSRMDRMPMSRSSFMALPPLLN